jgi:hypothetical protein
MYGKKRAAEVVKAYEAAVALTAREAMEALDIEQAKAELED